VDTGRLSLRLLALLLIAVIPLLVVFATVMFFAPDWVADVGVGSALLLVTLGALVWVGILTVTGARRLGDDLRRLVELAEHGLRTTQAPGGVPPSGEAQRRLGLALDERNRQIASLATQVRDIPLGSDATSVARAVVAAARAATHDATWTLAVVRAEAGSLAPGIYFPEQADPQPLEEVHGWASVAGAEILESEVPGVRHSEGPWGAFVSIDLSAGEELSAMLLAPWEGRPPPTIADTNFYSLLGQQAGSALEHALLYARIRSQADELHRMAEVQRDFLRGVTHDLQTPLTSIRAIAQEFAARPDLDAAARADLQVIEHQADRLRRMVGQLLTVTRLDAGALIARQEVFRAEPILRRTWRALLPAGGELDMESDGSLLVADPDRVEQIAWALLDNALKYGGRDKPLQVRVTSRARRQGDDRLASSAPPSELVAELSVADRGFGMSSEALAHAFEQFYRSDVARAAAPDGSGIGLYAARGLAALMGGSMTAESEPGAGSTFRVFLPAEPGATEENDPGPNGASPRASSNEGTRDGPPWRP
jgi:signal transduction histidine kinase